MENLALQRYKVVDRNVVQFVSSFYQLVWRSADVEGCCVSLKVAISSQGPSLGTLVFVLFSPTE